MASPENAGTTSSFTRLFAIASRAVCVGILPAWLQLAAFGQSQVVAPTGSQSRSELLAVFAGRFDRSPETSPYFAKTITADQGDALIARHEKPWAAAWGAATDYDLDDPGTLCKAVGIFRGPGTDVGFIFLVRDDVITMINSGDGHIENRRFYLDRNHPNDLRPTWYGDSVGRLEGDTLVVDTVGFNDKTWLSQSPTRHSEDLHVVERFRFVEKDVLQHIMTIEDPRALTSPFTLTWYYKKSPEPFKQPEMVCEGTPEARRAWLKMYFRALEQQKLSQKEMPAAAAGGKTDPSVSK